MIGWVRSNIGPIQVTIVGQVIQNLHNGVGQTCIGSVSPRYIIGQVKGPKYCVVGQVIQNQSKIHNGVVQTILVRSKIQCSRSGYIEPVHNIMGVCQTIILVQFKMKQGKSGFSRKLHRCSSPKYNSAGPSLTGSDPLY